MAGKIDKWIDGGMDRQTDQWMDAWMGYLDGCMDGWMDGWMDGQIDIKSLCAQPGETTLEALEFWVSVLISWYVFMELLLKAIL